jgi:hypothetical protein
MRHMTLIVLAACAPCLAACADSGQPQHDTAEQQNRHQLCQSWVGDPNDEKCLSTFRRILP